MPVAGFPGWVTSVGQAPEAAAAPEPGSGVSVRAVRVADGVPAADGAVPDLGALTSLQVLRALDSGPRGLTDAVADARLRQFGENTLPARRPVPWFVRFLRSVRDPFTAVLLCLGVVSSLVAAWGTACVITALVVVSCALRSAGSTAPTVRWVRCGSWWPVRRRCCGAHRTTRLRWPVRFRSTSWCQATWSGWAPAIWCPPICGCCGPSV